MNASSCVHQQIKDLKDFVDGVSLHPGALYLFHRHSAENLCSQLVPFRSHDIALEVENIQLLLLFYCLFNHAGIMVKTAVME